jgi:hypothetical protein
MELKHHAPSATLYAATFGRGMWRIPTAALVPPSPQPPASSPVTKPRRSYLGLPRTRSCRSTPTRLAFRVKGGKGVRLRSAVIRVGGRKVATLRGVRLRRTLRVRLPRGRVRVSVTAVTSTGRTLRASRTYPACPKRKKA